MPDAIGFLPAADFVERTIAGIGHRLRSDLSEHVDRHLVVKNDG
jgi:hypothetical protein